MNTAIGEGVSAGTVMPAASAWAMAIRYSPHCGTNGEDLTTQFGLVRSVPDPDKYDDQVRLRLHADPEWQPAAPAIAR